MIARITSLAVTPAARSPLTSMAIVFGRIAGTVWVATKLKSAPWVGEIATGDKLEQLGIAVEGGLVAGISLARSPEPNEFGVAGQRWASFNGPEFKGLGFGQHGGWGPDETRPFLIVDHPGAKPRRRTERTSLIDIAPTILTVLGLPVDGMEGKPIVWD